MQAIAADEVLAEAVVQAVVLIPMKPGVRAWATKHTMKYVVRQARLRALKIRGIAV